ncbi:S4 domain-containing protein [Bosea sp. (in: a-proteobacteria)]|uniref:RNA-binding S4 domain-containing protein n=1 Tax=Bosea sp. (in: a-proteobacteria) TaxID=1871050 RepID=UPI0026189041|nr:S4 domain-containing protein [Bosea sp. (in: a-proteobacteria)]MCO5089431.1 S4 domain-containing protein [Bosea sp. (in: a-proteobacteria)]
MREDRQRFDKWLWFARFARTRPAAVRLVADGHVRVEGRRADNPAQGIRPGTVLTLALPHATVVVRVLGFAERRGAFAVARGLYERLDGGSGDVSLAEAGGED